MSQVRTIHGYAIPFHATADVENGLEAFDRRAFDNMLARGTDVSLVWGSHERHAPVLARNIELFVDSYGLGFAAEVDLGGGGAAKWCYLRAMTTRKAPVDQCSIGGLQILQRRRNSHPRFGEQTVVTEATISHIAIVGNAVYGRRTGAWPADEIESDQAPWRLRQLAARWDVGHERWRLSQVRAQSAIPRAPRQPVFTAAQLQHFANVRNSYAMELVSGKASGVIFAHAAFSKAAGFDGNFRQLISRR